MELCGSEEGWGSGPVVSTGNNGIHPSMAVVFFFLKLLFVTTVIQSVCGKQIGMMMPNEETTVGNRLNNT